VHSAGVLEKQKRDFQQKQENASRTTDLSFDHKTRKWNSSQYFSQSQSQSPTPLEKNGKWPRTK
jgi:hypothetical protein